MTKRVFVDGNKEDANPYFAELATYNWPFALYSEIINNYGDNYESWKQTLTAHCQSIPQNFPNNVVDLNFPYNLILSAEIKRQLK